MNEPGAADAAIQSFTAKNAENAKSPEREAVVFVFFEFFAVKILWTSCEKAVKGNEEVSIARARTPATLRA